MNEITIHSLLPHQLPAGQSTARFKVIAAGRRWGKTAFDENVSLLGHGPVVDGLPMFRGLIHGLDVIWMTPTNPQASTMWHNDVVPRFKNRDARIKVNETARTVTFQNPDGTPYATLWVRSAESPDSVRGPGKKLGGVVIDEAAHMDLEYLWRQSLRPTLMDCGAWAIINSTTNAASDGHIDPDSGGQRTPSFFNILCDQIEAGQRDGDWAYFYGTAQDNPKIKASEFDKLVAEYPTPNDPRCQEEVFAKRIIAGAGVAFPEWDDNVHVARVEPGPRWRAACGGDWGYVRMGWLGLLFTGPERSILRHEYAFRETKPYTVGFNWGIQCLGFARQGLPLPEWHAIDTPAVSDGGPTIIDQLQAGYRDALRHHGPEETQPGAFLNPPKGPGSRETKKVLLHGALKYSRVPGDDGVLSVPDWARPELLVHPDCVEFIRTIRKLPRDPKRRDDVDTTALDDPYDGVTSWLMARIPQVERDRITSRDTDSHPGFEIERGRVREKAAESYWRHVLQPAADDRTGLGGTPRWERLPQGVGR